jgi:hypothetical protein
MPERSVGFHDTTYGKPANQIDERVNVTCLSDYLIHEAPDVGFIGNIGLHVRVTFRLNRRWMLVDRDDPGTCRDEGRNNRLAQRSGSSGNQHDAAFRSHLALHRALFTRFPRYRSRTAMDDLAVLLLGHRNLLHIFSSKF